jgi:hypothetical protein
MRLILLVLMLSTPAWGHDDNQERPVPVSEDPTHMDYIVGQEFGVSERQIDSAKRRINLTFNRRPVERRVANTMEQTEAFAKETDKALDALIRQAQAVMRAKGYDREADEIGQEYADHYQDAFLTQYLGVTKEIGDHPPLNEWLVKVHNKIEETIGEFLCKYFHLHDLYIFNYATPVVFKPKLYLLPEYLDHFSGHLYAGANKWKHHGLAGVVTYWAVNITCQVGTMGMGAVTFVCGPIAGFSENIMDKRIAPPIGTKIWKKANP